MDLDGICKLWLRAVGESRGNFHLELDGAKACSGDAGALSSRIFLSLLSFRQKHREGGQIRHGQLVPPPDIVANILAWSAPAKRYRHHTDLVPDRMGLRKSRLGLQEALQTREFI